MPTALDLVPHIRALYAEWSASRGRNVEAWLELFADDVKVRSLSDGAPGLEFTRHGTGKDVVRAYVTGLRAAWEMIYFTADAFVAQDDRVVMLGRCAFRHRGTHKEFETAKVDVLRLQGGKIVEFQEFYDTAGMEAAATA